MRLRAVVLMVCGVAAVACAGQQMARPGGGEVKRKGTRSPAPLSLPDQPEEGGELRDLQLSNGVVAQRVFRDELGHMMRRILYVPNRPSYEGVPAPGRKDLLEHSTVVYQRTPAGKVLIEATYDARRDLARTVTYTYWPDGSLRRAAYTRFRDDHGVLYAQERRNRAGERTLLTWEEADGERKLLKIEGRVPADVDLPDGWGAPEGGLRCGIVFRPELRVVRWTVTNVSSQPRRLPAGRVSELFRPVLVTAAGKTVPCERERIRQRLSRRERPGPVLLPPGHATSGFQVLDDWYGELPPGRYALSLRVRTEDGGQDLVSNRLEITISPPALTLSAEEGYLGVLLTGWHPIEVHADRVVERYSGLTMQVSQGTGMTVEGVRVNARPGNLELEGAERTWTVSWEDNRVHLVASGRKNAGQRWAAGRFCLGLHEGEVRLLRSGGDPASPEAP